ncbi:hypothetical protein [Sphingobacterium hotanense]|uniref:hypothetical protein n=1 Tax=Sphingobacterium hotanense TaxID=649196 RepID=UPI0021A3CF05|nr:hypothetical protein [Sphingobacterium hotanense]MCT1526969.1 hypothetical protein [Sphingobacterium hotanense]
MIRNAERTPSFFVNPQKGIWYDHGGGQGGNIIDLAMLLFQTESIPDIIKKFNQMYGNGILPEIKKFKETTPTIEEPKHEIKHIRPLGGNLALLNYLESRGVRNEALASTFLKEVYYDYLGDDGSRKPYFGVGWQNASGGWDIRSAIGKVCLLKKDYFVKLGNNGRSSTFEGMLNYLSALTENTTLSSDTIIVLNSLSMSERAIDFLKSQKEISRHGIYLDHGTGGWEFTKMFLAALPGSRDRSDLYAGYGDYNDKIKAGLKSVEHPQKTPNRRR